MLKTYLKDGSARKTSCDIRTSHRVLTPYTPPSGNNREQEPTPPSSPFIKISGSKEKEEEDGEWRDRDGDGFTISPSSINKTHREVLEKNKEKELNPRVV